MPHDHLEPGDSDFHLLSSSFDPQANRLYEPETDPRREKAMRYLERKRIRQERFSQEVDAGLPSEQEPYAVEITPMALPVELAKGPLTPLPMTIDLEVAVSSIERDTPPKLPAISVSALPALRTRAAVLSRPVSTSSLEAARWQRHRKILLRHLVRKHLRQSRIQEHQSLVRWWLTIGSSLVALFLVLLSMTGAGAVFAYQFYYDTQTRYVPRVSSLRELLPHDNLKIFDSRGKPLAQLTDQGLHTSVTLKDISQDLVNATVSIEDKNFWTNGGVDVFRIAQAAVNNLRSGHVVEGGSTITQQLIKNLVVGNDTSVMRKMQEVVLTPEMNEHYTKSDIMEMYLNSIYYGEQAYGIDAAATIYFGLEDQPNKPAASQLTLAQSAMLASIPSSPYSNDPLVYPERAFERFKHVLALMNVQGYATTTTVVDAIKEAQDPHFFKRPKSLENRAPHFVDFVLKQLEQQFHLKRSQLSRSDLIVYTTLDTDLQDKIQKIAQDHIATLRDAHHISNAAEVLIDYHTGAIRSLLGSLDYNNKQIDGQYDVATQGYRQPGSSFKPYVYVTALAQGASAAQAVSDEPLTLNLPGEYPPTFSPHNYDEQFHGHMTLRCALQNSLNIPAVKVLKHVGINEAMKTAKEMGIDSYQGTPGYSLVLGGLGVHLIDHVSAFGTFANGGVHVPYYAIEKVVFANSHMTWGHPQNQGKRVLSPQLAYMMTNILSDNKARLPQFYDCNVLQLYANSQYACQLGNRGVVRPAAVKTGTTNDFRDNWTIGYTTDYVMGVWAGNNDNSRMYDVTGVSGAAPIWHAAMLLAEQGKPIRDFANPGGLEWATVTYPDGVKTSDWFIPGTVPSFNLPQPTPTPIGTPTVQPKKNHHLKAQKPAQSYCPSSYDFTFAPPPDGTNPPNPDAWW